MTHRTVLFFLIAVVFAGGCESLTEQPREVRELTAQERQIVEADNRFGLNLFRALSDDGPGENLFISPLSISMALGMTLNGAVGETRMAMEIALEKTGLTIPEINEGYQGLIELLTELDEKVAFQIANSIWYREGFPVESSFIDTNTKYFDAEVRSLDFSSALAARTINEWVKQKTNNRIEKIIDGMIPGNVVMYLINAIHFKGDWKYPFDKKHTRDDLFTLQDGSQVPVKMMTRHLFYPYFQTPEFQAVDLPYGDSLFSMTLLLPTPDIDVNTLAERITSQQWDEWMGRFTSSNVQVELPRFQIEYEKSLVEVLASLGMEIAFTPAADFSKITPGGGIWIGDVLHKTFVDVNEEGTEAAAVTSVVMITSMPPAIRFDRPFIFAIRENHSGTILFIGKIMNPAA